MRRLALLLALLSLPSLATAQDAAQPPPTPAVRLDFDVPSVGVGAGSLERDPALVWSLGVRVASRTGDGAYGAFTYYDGSPSFALFGGSEAHAEGWMVDAGYLRRVRLVGDDRLGLGLDLLGGFTIGDLAYHQGSSGWCWSGCSSSSTSAPESVADGTHAGASVGASLDLRAWGFTIGLDARYRLMFATDRVGEGERMDQHVVQAGVHLGWAVY